MGFSKKVSKMGLLDSLQNFGTNLSRSPLGMASLGLLLQPRKRPIGTGPLNAALPMMRLGAYNQQAAEEAKWREQIAARQIEADKAREALYQAQIAEYGQRAIERQEAQSHQKMLLDAADRWASTNLNSIEEAQAWAGLPPDQKIKIMQARQFSGAGLDSGNLPAGIQEYLYNQGDPGYMEFRRKMASLSPEAQAAAAYGRAFQSQAGQIAGQYENREAAAAARLAAEEAAQIGAAKGQVSMAPQVAQAEASKQAQILATQEQEKRKQTALATIRPLEMKAEQSIDLLNEFMNHPGFESVVGAGLGRLTKHIPGTDAAGASAIWENIQSKNFLSSIEAFRGFGQLSNAEGQAAARAYSDMSTATSEKDFMKAAQRFYDHYVRLTEVAKQEAGVNNGAP